MNLFSAWCVIMLCCAFSSLSAQVTMSGRVIDRENGEPLAFVAVYQKDSHRGTHTDIDGKFSLSVDEGSQVTFTYIGYEALMMPAKPGTNLEVPMNRKSVVLNEVVIRPGVNPAERIIKAAIANKKENNPERDETFTYDSYNKLVFTADIDSATYNDPAMYNSLDSSNREMVDFFAKQHIFLMESVSQRKFMPPARSEETIVATRVSGLKNPEFALLGTQLQSFSFYGESVSILDITYLSPLANGSISKYLFILEDTTYTGNDTVFTISFRPRLGKNFDGMKGQLFINTDGYALQNVIAEPSETKSFSIRIQQMYEKVENRKWFPVQLNTFISLPFAQMNSFPLVGIGRSYLKNIRLGVPMKALDFTPVTLQMAPGATQQPDSVWNQFRVNPLDVREQTTYHVIDSVGKAENFDAFVRLANILASGMIPMGPVNLDLNRLMRFNDYEGFRLGLGLATNDKISKHMVLSGYYAYGFRDTHSKYGGAFRLHLYKKRNMWAEAFYEQDVAETGGNHLRHEADLKWKDYYQLLISRMDRYEKKGMRLNGRMIGNLTATLTVEETLVKTFNGYYHTYTSNDLLALQRNAFNLFTTGTELRYAPGERLARVGNREVRLGGRWPVMRLRWIRGWDDRGDGEIAYDRLDAAIEKTFRIKNIGHFTARVTAGAVEQDVPLSLLSNPSGSNTVNYSERKYLGLSAPFTFEAMRVNEFFHSHFAAVQLRHDFRNLLIKGEKFRPNIVLVHNMLWGKMKFTESHTIEARQALEGYYESGLIFDNLVSSGISSFGLGTFYRYGPYSLPKAADNLAVKLSLSFSF